jgi:CRP/FNR family transcriptional regulator, cyclic AMP receptor protein
MSVTSDFKEGDVLFRQGSAGDCVMRIVDGEVEVVREVDGVPVTLGYARASEWLGEMAVIENRAHSATARATTNGVVEILTVSQFLDLIIHDPVMALDVIIRLSMRLRRLDDKFASQAVSVESSESASGINRHDDAGLADSPVIVLAANHEMLRNRIGALPIPVNKLPYVVGRLHMRGEEVSSMAPDLLVEDSPPFRLSRQHFVIARNRGQLCVSDLGSTLGTVVNGQPIGNHFMRDTAPLIHGDNDIIAGGTGSPYQFVVSVSRVA